MTALSVLDLSPVIEGGSPADSMRNSLDLARRAEALGYRRYWVAEHHNMPGIASAATSVVIAHIAGGTSTIRVGAGGIMLPNHAPLVIAEQFGTLDALFPRRIDLGLGRAPGTDQRTAFALRRTLHGDPDDFPRDVLELLGYFAEPHPDDHVRAIPGSGQYVPVWILGSSLYGAQLAAMLGLPYAFASHFAPRRPDAGARHLPRDVPALRAVCAALGHGRIQRVRGRDRRGRAPPAQLRAPVDAGAPPGQAGPPAATGRRVRIAPEPPRTRDARRAGRVLRGRPRRPRSSLRWSDSSSVPAWTS